jgi:hypothetical protein
VKTLSIINRTNAILVINLPHNLVPECATRGVVAVREHNGETGERTLVAHKKAISGSITLLAKGSPDNGDRVDGLPLTVRAAPDVRINAGRQAIDVLEIDDRVQVTAPISTGSVEVKPEVKKSKGA